MTLYYDISEIFNYVQYQSTVSGIQRVSLNILSCLARQHGGEELRVVAWHPRKRGFRSYDPSFFARGGAFEGDLFIRRFGLVHPLVAAARSLRTGARTAKDAGRPIVWRNGDVVFVPGATWGLDGYLAALREVSRRGVAVHQLVHDLIPLTTPEHVVDGMPRRFEAWLSDLSNFVAGFVANSEATHVDLAAWLAHKRHDIPIRVLPLAHQFGLADRVAVAPRSVWQTPDNVSARVQNAARAPYVLCVGTLEARKNLWSLANAWHSIHAQLGEETPRLVIAGSRGWLNDDFENFITGTGSLNGYISVLDRPSDAELAYLYQRCLFSMFVSYKEGWGLPIGEALWFGRPVICSAVSSMPEVGGQFADYADPASIRSIAEAALRLIRNVDYREARAREIAAARLRTWQDVAADLWHHLGSRP